MSQEECYTANWRQIGFEDGSEGQPVAQLSSRRKACASYNIQPDFQQYTAGYQQGLQQYCQPNRGFQAGIRGETYYGVCPASLDKAFVSSYHQGKAIFDQRRTIDSLDIKKRNLEQDIDEMNEDIRSSEALLVSDGLNSSQRSELLGKIRQLNRKIGKANGDIIATSRKLEAVNIRLQNMLKKSPYS